MLKVQFMRSDGIWRDYPYPPPEYTDNDTLRLMLGELIYLLPKYQFRLESRASHALGEPVKKPG